MSANGQTSVYHPFPDSNAIWNFDSYQWCGLGFDNWEHLYSIKMTGDTVINSTNYHKLEVPAEVIESNGMCNATGSWTISGHYAGSVRQDSALKMVYFVPPSETTEQLLYDFNMVVGDTVIGYTSTHAYPADTVQSIDSVLVGNSYRKRWKLSSVYEIYFIEGIGSTYGLVELSPGWLVDHNSYTLTCFQQNGLTLYPNTTMNCDLITGVNNIASDKFLINIYPNPFHTTALLQLHPDFSKGDLKVYNSLGSLITTQTISNQNSLTLNRDNLSNGLYLLHLTNSRGQMTVEKLIIE